MTGRERSVRYIYAVGYGFLGLVLVAALYDYQRRPIEIDITPAASADTRPKLDETLDPNQAPWYELARLPSLGEIRAKAIVAHRDATTTPFRNADDLQAVRGIGPKTAEKLRPYLRFDSQPTVRGEK